VPSADILERAGVEQRGEEPNKDCECFSSSDGWLRIKMERSGSPSSATQKTPSMIASNSPAKPTTKYLFQAGFAKASTSEEAVV
jgi:hypothetical protein